MVGGDALPNFQLVSDFRPMGDQPAAIAQLLAGLGQDQTLLGATGTGKSLGYDDPVFVVEKRGNTLASRCVNGRVD